MAAPIGNKNGAGKHEWSDAIRKAVMEKEDGKPRKLKLLAQMLVKKAVEGDISALREVGDRLDGKPAQAILAAVYTPNLELGSNELARRLAFVIASGSLLPALEHKADD